MKPRLRLYDTLTRRLSAFEPLHPPEVGLYTCGPTVYQYAHIGNLRAYLFEDLLRRSLRAFGFQARHVMNITDVGHLTSDADTGEDKMELGARRLKKSAWEIAAFFTEAFFRDVERLNCLRPTVVVKATDYVVNQKARWDMLRLISALEKKGLTYRTSDGLYFDTARLPDYGKLAGAAHLGGLQAGSRVEANPEKKNPSDFALWKFSPQGQKRQMEWDSPWGRGFPGWHIECSAMAMDNLGETLDIHCGGVDHIAVHHTNEIAQSEGATGRPFVRFWLHGEFLVLSGKTKMAKSSGNFLTLESLVEEGKNRGFKAGYDPLAYRYLCLTAHYRTQLDFHWEAMDAAQKSLDTLRTHFWRLSQEAGSVLDASRPRDLAEPGAEAFLEALSEDLNAPRALAAAWQAARGEGPLPARERVERLRAFDEVLGLDLAALSRRPPPGEVVALIGRREEARGRKDYKSADSLRDEIGAFGFYVEDTPQGARLVKKP